MHASANAETLSISITFSSVDDFRKFRDSWDNGGAYVHFESAMTAQQLVRAMVDALEGGIRVEIAAGRLKP